MKDYARKIIFGQNVINIYIFMFIFSMINREFVPFNIDLRYIQILMAGAILFNIFIKSINRIKRIKFEEIKENIIRNKYFFIVVALYSIFFLSNINWLNNGLEYQKSDFFKMNILYIYNLMTIIIVYINRDKIKVNYIVRSIVLASIVLFGSMLLITLGFSSGDIMASDYPLKYSGGDHFNFFGGIDRIAGYAQDPNYASFFMLLLIITTIFYIEKKMHRIILLSIGTIGYMLSASKTLIIAIVVIIAYIIMVKMIKERKILRYFDNMLLIGLTILPVLLIKLLLSYNATLNLDTMRTRMSMWGSAINLFESNPILGNGITSFRVYYENTATGWYVHSHNTSLQILSESGFINYCIFLLVIFMLFRKVNLYGKSVVILFLVFAITYELTYLSIFAFIIGIMFLFQKDLVKDC